MSSSTVSVSASAIAPFYTTDLEAKVACVLDRDAFLDSVTDAINHETKREDAHEMVAMMAANGFVPLIAALLKDKHARTREKAYLAFGNLIASENKKMSFLATATAVKELSTIASTLYCATGIDDKLERGGAAFVFANIAQFLAPVMATDTRNDMRNILEKTLRMNLDWSKNVRMVADLLRAAHYLEAWEQTPTQIVLDSLDQQWNRCFNSALRILGEQVSEDFNAEFRDPAFQTLRTLLLSDRVPKSQTQEFFWTFSNLVVESGVADLFMNDDLVVTKVCDVIDYYLDHKNSYKAYEPIYTLVNAIARCSTLLPLTDVQLDRVENVLLDAEEYMDDKTALRKAIAEALNTVGAERVHRADLAAEQEMETLLREINSQPIPVEDEGEDMEIDDYACGCDISGAGAGAASAFNFNLPCERPAPAPVCNETQHFNPPSALDLLRRNLNYAPTSAIVNNLILSVEAAGGAYVPVPENTVLTVSDLSAIEARGFAIVRGHIGINAALSAVFFNA